MADQEQAGSAADGEGGAMDSIPPRVRVLYPDGGETFAAKSRVTIRWSAGDDRGVVVQRVQLSLDGGKTHRDLCPALDGTVQSVEWIVPSTPCERARIRVVARDAAGNLGLDTSNGCFTITEAGPDKQAPTVELQGPAEGAALRGGERLELRFRSSDDMGVAQHRLSLSVDGGASFNPIASLPADATGHALRLPRLATTRARLRLEAVDDSGNSGVALGPVFTIVLPDGEGPAWDTAP